MIRNVPAQCPHNDFARVISSVLKISSRCPYPCGDPPGRRCVPDADIVEAVCLIVGAEAVSNQSFFFFFFFWHFRIALVVGT